MAQLTEQRSGTGAGEVNPGIVTAYVVTVGLFVLSVLIQAFLAGRGLYSDFDLIDVHGGVANLVFLLAVGQLVLAVMATKGSAQRSLLVGLGAVLLVLTVGQIGLGYAIEEERGLGGWHIVNGVLIFGLATANLVLAMGNRR